MAFTVDFYQFAKAVNSTKRPAAGTAGLSASCTLKDGCSIYQPQIQLQLAITTTPLYNYAFIAAFDRYYFIDNWTFQDRLWTASLTCDVLGSWRNMIGNQTKYVLRSSFQNDPLIRDDYYPITGPFSDEWDTTATSWWNEDDFALNGCYVVSTVSGDSTATLGNGVSYLIMDAQGFRSFANAVLNQSLTAYDDSQGSLAALGTAVAKIIMKPFEYVTSVKWYPFGIPASITNHTPSLKVISIHVGFWSFNVTTGNIYAMPTAKQTSFVHTFTIHQHPLAATRGVWLNTSPYTNVQLHLPRLGVVPVDVNRLYTEDSLRVTLTIDLCSGESRYIIEAFASTITDPARILSEYTIMMGVDIPITQVDVSVSNIAQEVTNAGAAIGATVATGGLTSVGAAIGSITRLYEPHIATSGGQQGSFLGLVGLGKVIVYYEFNNITNEDIDNVGRPLCQNVTLSGIPGYIKCLDGHIELPDAFKQELELIEGYLVNGFYWE